MVEQKLLVLIDGIDYRVLINPERWQASTKPYLEDCGHEVKVLCSFNGAHEITDDLLSDLLEPRDK